MSVPKLLYSRECKNNGSVLNSNSFMLNGSRAGTDNRGWRARVKAGYQAGSNYSTSRYDIVVHQPGFINSTEEFYDNLGQPVNKRSQNLTGIYLGVDTAFNHYQDVTTTQENEAIMKLISKIRSESSGANGLLVFAELRETLHMLRNPAEALRKMTTQLIDNLNIQRSVVLRTRQRKSETMKSFSDRRRKMMVKGFSGTWLEYQFGVQPFLSDVEDLAKTAYDHITQPRKRTRLMARSTEFTASQTYPEVASELAPNVRLFSTEVRNGKSGVQYIVGMAPSVIGPDRPLARLAQSFGLTIENFVPTVYEIIPYSFLIDYFSNLGDIITAASTCTSNVLWIVRTVRQRTEYGVITTRAEPISPKTGNGVYRTVDFSMSDEILGKSIVSLTSVERTCPSSIPIPKFQMEIPGSSSLKWANMAALLASSRSNSMRF